MPLISYIGIAQKFKLPLRIDMRVKMDSPSIYLILGKGHVSLGTSFLDNRRIGDIVEQNPKITSAFDNSLEMNAWSDISVIYGLKQMQILVNGEERYFSSKEKYMRSLIFSEVNSEGFDLKIAGSKLANLALDFVRVTEYEDNEIAVLGPKGNNLDSKICLSVDRKVKSDFDECISKLSTELKEAIYHINDFLLNCKNLKVKRKIEGSSQACKISCVSSHGFSYSIHVSEKITDHFFWWNMVSNYTYENKYMGRKNDYTNITLSKVAERSPEIAALLFSYYDECVGCSSGCHVKTFYEYSGKKKAVCHGKMIMNMNVSTFNNILYMFRVLAEILS